MNLAMPSVTVYAIRSVYNLIGLREQAQTNIWLVNARLGSFDLGQLV